jgi:hypothetical protein
MAVNGLGVVTMQVKEKGVNTPVGVLDGVTVIDVLTIVGVLVGVRVAVGLTITGVTVPIELNVTRYSP